MIIGNREERVKSEWCECAGIGNSANSRWKWWGGLFWKGKGATTTKSIGLPSLSSSTGNLTC